MGRILNELASSTTRRSKSARRLALHVLDNPAAVIDKPIGVLAREVGVSEPTVNRFCTALGLKGYPDFKLQLARELARRRAARSAPPWARPTAVLTARESAGPTES